MLIFMGNHPLLTIIILLILFEGVKDLIRVIKKQYNDDGNA